MTFEDAVKLSPVRQAIRYQSDTLWVRGEGQPILVVPFEVAKNINRKAGEGCSIIEVEDIQPFKDWEPIKYTLWERWLETLCKFESKVGFRIWW